MVGISCFENSTWRMDRVTSCLYDLDRFPSYVTDGTVAILIGSLPLVLPDRNPFTGSIDTCQERRFPPHVYSSQLEIQAHPSVGSFVENLSLGRLHVARCRFGHCRCLQGTTKQTDSSFRNTNSRYALGIGSVEHHRCFPAIPHRCSRSCHYFHCHRDQCYLH